jgi:replicative DNA helicase
MDLKPSDKLQQAILGCMLLFPGERRESNLSEADFIGREYRDVFRYLQDNQDADITRTSAALNIPEPDLMRWMESEFSAAFLPGYCRDLRELSSKAKLYQAMTDIRNKATELSATELYELAEKTILGLSVPNGEEMKPVKRLANEAFKRLESRYQNRGIVQGMSYGFQELDRLTGGAQRGDMVVIAGRPSMGKSAFAMNIIENMAAGGYKTAVFSMEMADVQLMDRMIASHSRVSLGRIRNGDFRDGDWSRLTSGFDKISKLDIHIDDTPGITLQEIKSKARQLKMKHGLDALAVDYVTLIKTENRRDSRAREVGELSRGLKQLARELDAPVFALCQLNRAGAGRKPVMADLRDSGEIEQDADVIFFPYREAADCQKCRDKVNDSGHDLKLHESQAEIIIEKQRNGPRNVTVPFTWIGEHQRFEEVVR